MVLIRTLWTEENFNLLRFAEKLNTFYSLTLFDIVAWLFHSSSRLKFINRYQSLDRKLEQARHLIPFYVFLLTYRIKKK
jgi:hypothetical protein